MVIDFLSPSPIHFKPSAPALPLISTSSPEVTLTSDDQKTITTAEHHQHAERPSLQGAGILPSIASAEQPLPGLTSGGFDESPASHPATVLLSALWGSPTACHQLVTAKEQVWTHHQVTDIASAVKKAKSLSDAGHEVYFACAEYLTPKNRRAENVLQS